MVLAFGAIVMGLGIVALSVIAHWWQLFAVYLLMSTSLASRSTTTIGGTLLPCFDQRRGRALALALMGSSVGGMVLVPLLLYLTTRSGFRTATVVAAPLLWGSLLPLVAFVIKRKPQDLGLLPDGMSAAEAGAGPVDVPGVREAGHQWSSVGALRSMSFWTIALPFHLGFIAQGGFLVHQLTFLQPSLGQTQAAFAVSATSAAALAGRLVLGFLSDYVDRRLLAVGCVTMQGLALALMAALPLPGALLLGSVTFGLGQGMLITLPPLLVQEEFGTASFGTVFAMVNGAMQVGVGVGPSIVGVLRDQGGGYHGALWVLVGIEAMAAVVVWCGRGLRESRSPGA